MACEWDKFPMGTVDVTPGWNVQMLCPNANNIAEQQLCRPNTWYIAGMAVIAGNAGTAATSNFYTEGTVGIYGGTTVSGQNS